MKYPTLNAIKEANKMLQEGESSDFVLDWLIKEIEKTLDI